MENVEKDLESFWDGLLDLLKYPWKKKPIGNEASPTSSNDEDTFGVYFNRLFMPYCIIVWYLCKTKVHFLRYALENEDVIPTNLLIQSSRLTSHELYDAFSALEPDNATLLLNRIDCPASVYTELKESLETGDKTRFISVIDELDLSEITPFLKLVRLVIKVIPERIDDISRNSEQPSDLDEETRKDKYLLEFEDRITGKFGLQQNSKEKQIVMSSMKKAVNLDVFPNSYLNTMYSIFFYQYCCMKEDNALNESDNRAFEYVFHQPAFEEQYNENMQWWEGGILDDKLEEFAKELGVEENDDEEVTNPSPRSGEKQRWRLQKYLSRPVQPSKEGQWHCKGIKESIVKKGDSALTKFIQGIADRGYIDDDPSTKNSFAYALTGRGGFRSGIIKVRWYHDKDKKGIPESVRVLLYISKNMFEATGETYTQLFKVLKAGINPCIKDGADQSSSYADKVSKEFQEFYETCFLKKTSNPIAK